MSKPENRFFPDNRKEYIVTVRIEMDYHILGKNEAAAIEGAKRWLSDGCNCKSVRMTTTAEEC